MTTRIIGKTKQSPNSIGGVSDSAIDTRDFSPQGHIHRFVTDSIPLDINLSSWTVVTGYSTVAPCIYRIGNLVHLEGIIQAPPTSPANPLICDIPFEFRVSSQYLPAQSFISSVGISNVEYTVAHTLIFVPISFVANMKLNLASLSWLRI